MLMLLIAGLIGLLYARTLRYKYLIDDWVKREGYYTVGIANPPWEFFTQRPSAWYRIFMIGMHIVNTWVIYMLWGFYPALIFGVHPMCIWGTAWVTGNYYATATFFTLVSFFILQSCPSFWTAVVAGTIFNAGINSTICPVSFPFLFVFYPWLATFFIPVAWLFSSRRFKKAIEVRNGLYDNKIEFGFSRLFLMTKIVARYTYQAIVPNKLYMFCEYGHDCKNTKDTYDRLCRADSEFYAGVGLLSSVMVLGYLINPFCIAWFFVCIGLHSQWNLVGQFYAQRYLYLALVGMVVIIGNVIFIYPIVGVAYVTWLVIRTNESIPAFRDINALWRNDIRMQPKYSEAYNNYAVQLFNMQGYIDEIEHILCEAERLDNYSWKTQLNMSKLLILKGEYADALRSCKKGIELCADKEVLKIFTKRKEELEEVLEKKMEYHPNWGIEVCK